MSSGTPQFNLSGLASGLDTNSMVTQLMQIERQPLVRLQSKQAVVEARQQALTDVRTRLANLQKAAAALRDPATWTDVQDVTSSDPTHLGLARTGGAAAGAYTVNVTRLAAADQYMQTSAGTTALADDTLQLSVGAGTVFSVDVKNGDSMDTIAARINGTTDIPVYATVAGGKLVVSAKTTGAANTVTIAGGAAAGLTFARTAAAHDAQLTVDSGLGPVSVTSSTNTITNAIAGVTLTLKSPSTATVTVGSPAPDSSGIQDKIQAFVDQYNSTISFVRGKLDENVVANPQSDADRTKGVLSGDTGLESVLSQLRQAMSDLVSGRPGATSTLAQVGVSTGSASGTIDKDAVAGKLKLDGVALTGQLTAHFSDVKALFTNATGSYAGEGAGQRIDRVLDPYLRTGGILDGRDASATSDVKTLKAEEDAWTPRLTAKEAALRQQFTAMEVALQQNQTLMSSVSAQLSRLSTY